MSLSLHYLIREPQIKNDTRGNAKLSDAKRPLLLLLHGYGSNEEDLFSFANELPDEYYVISARAPFDLMYGSYAWYAINFDADENKFSDIGQARASRDIISNFIDELLANFPIDSNNITLIGFSQGCILSYAVGLSYPEKVQRIVAMSGYLNTEIAVDDFAKNNVSNLKIFASHGTVDQVIPVDWARKSIPILEKLGVSVVFKEYPVGHGVAPQNFFDLKNWLQS
ncbi:alpha/beta hydrolase [Flavobacterium sp.]|jgi:phospholipase/carboxylesterase|uniref:alpha/beta hydrolase n=1 Tax=Flavobacterium sp. TaxID=239 RepID=UPI0037BF50B5